MSAIPTEAVPLLPRIAARIAFGAMIGGAKFSASMSWRPNAAPGVYGEVFEAEADAALVRFIDEATGATVATQRVAVGSA